jgi:formiminotetrahydrofolate cyclodeaminase
VISEPLARFLDRLASAEPTPGGGSAAAIAGAMAAALLAMVSRLTKTNQEGATIDAVATEMDKGRATLLDLAAKDAQAFDDVMRAMRMAKDTDEQRRARQHAIQQALIEAAAVPLAVAAHGLEVLKRAVLVARRGNVNAISDVGVAALLAYAAVHGAILNVRINLAGIKDAGYVAATDTRVNELVAASDHLRDEVMGIVQSRFPK